MGKKVIKTKKSFSKYNGREINCVDLTTTNVDLVNAKSKTKPVLPEQQPTPSTTTLAKINAPTVNSQVQNDMLQLDEALSKITKPRQFIRNFLAELKTLVIPQNDHAAIQLLSDKIMICSRLLNSNDPLLVKLTSLLESNSEIIKNNYSYLEKSLNSIYSHFPTREVVSKRLIVNIRELTHHLSQDIFETSFKLKTTRNPVELFISKLNFKMKISLEDLQKLLQILQYDNSFVSYHNFVLQCEQSLSQPNQSWQNKKSMNPIVSTRAFEKLSTIVNNPNPKKNTTPPEAQKPLAIGEITQMPEEVLATQINVPEVKNCTVEPYLIKEPTFSNEKIKELSNNLAVRHQVLKKARESEVNCQKIRNLVNNFLSTLSPEYLVSPNQQSLHKSQFGNSEMTPIWMIDEIFTSHSKRNFSPIDIEIESEYYMKHLEKLKQVLSCFNRVFTSEEALHKAYSITVEKITDNLNELSYLFKKICCNYLQISVELPITDNALNEIRKTLETSANQVDMYLKNNQPNKSDDFTNFYKCLGITIQTKLMWLNYLTSFLELENNFNVRQTAISDILIDSKSQLILEKLAVPRSIEPTAQRARLFQSTTKKDSTRENVTANFIK